MIAVVQRVAAARVNVGAEVVGQIADGLVALVSVHADDTVADLAWTAQKLTTLRIFSNGEKFFDLDIRQVSGSLLLVSNFTVAADTSSGRRPGLSPAAGPAIAAPLFEQFLDLARATGIPVQTGRFGADMHVHIDNDGPVTLIIDSRTARKKTPAAGEAAGVD